MNKSNLIWLASYPKSGNTWVRMFLSTIKNNSISSQERISEGQLTSCSRVLFEGISGVDSLLLGSNEIQNLRCKVFQKLSNSLDDEIIIKTHDSPFYKGIRVIPKEATKKVILIVRNPFDLVGSYANHNSANIDDSVRQICNDSLIMNKKNGKHVRQHWGSWSAFYQNWLNVFRENILLVQYEDLMSDPFLSFSRILKFLEWDFSESEIQRSIKACSFDKCQEKEEKYGFSEKPNNSSAFFRKGKVGSWKQELNNDHVDYLIDKHFEFLLKMRYISSDGKVLV